MELYNSMVGKEGIEGEREAKKAYKAARKDSDGALEEAISDKVSSALTEKVILWLCSFICRHLIVEKQKETDYLLLISWIIFWNCK